MSNTTGGIKVRLGVFYFLEFAIWGAYLTSLGAYLGKINLGDVIGWFYSSQGFVSIFMPALIGIVADRWIPAQKMMSICQLLAGGFMCAAGIYGMVTYDPVTPTTQFGPLFTLYVLSIAFFMPTIGLSNSVGYSSLSRAGLDTVKHFPPIRVFGTVGFICSMLFVNFTGFQNNYCQMLTSGCLSFVLMAYSLTMPNCPVNREKKSGGITEALGLKAFRLFKDRQMAVFFIFSMFLGVSLQITNGYANPYIQSFGDIPIFKDNWGVKNANALIALSQASETLCILLIPVVLRRFGIKVAMLMSMTAWVFRFGFFGLGNPGSGVWLFILSMIVYGIAFDFFNVSGSLFVDQKTNANIRSSAQGLFMLMTNGVGASVGMLIAQAVVNHYTSGLTGEELIAGWHKCWYIFAAYSAVVALFFLLLFRYKHNPDGTVAKAEIDGGDPEGYTGAQNAGLH